MRSSFIFLCVLACSACAPLPPVPPVPPPAAGAMTLGMSDVDGTFAPFTEGQDVTLVSGAQGGFHVWLAYRYDGVPGGDAKLSRGAHRLVDDAIVLRTSAEITVAVQSPPMPMFMCPSPIGLSVIDQPIVFELSMQPDDGSGLVAQHITLVPHCPDAERDFCLRICTG